MCVSVERPALLPASPLPFSSLYSHRWRSCDPYAPNGENEPEDPEGPEGDAAADIGGGIVQRRCSSPLSPHCSPNISVPGRRVVGEPRQQYLGVEGAVLRTPTHGGRRVWGSSKMVLASPKVQLASIEGDEDAGVSTRGA